MATRNYIDLVEKTMAVVEALARVRRPCSLKELVAATGLVKGSVYRILFTLRELGYVEQMDDARYGLSPKVVTLVRAGVQPDLLNLSRPHLVRLRDKVGESAWLAERRGPHVVLVAGAETSHPLRLSLRVGDRCPLYASALGKVTAASLPGPELAEILNRTRLAALTRHTITDRVLLDRHLEKVRRQGYATNEQETTEGACFVGAPVFDAQHRNCAAVSVSVPLARWAVALRNGIVQEVKDTAEAMSAELASLGFEPPAASAGVQLLSLPVRPSVSGSVIHRST